MQPACSAGTLCTFSQNPVSFAQPRCLGQDFTPIKLHSLSLCMWEGYTFVLCFEFTSISSLKFFFNIFLQEHFTSVSPTHTTTRVKRTCNMWELLHFTSMITFTDDGLGTYAGTFICHGLQTASRY